MLPGHLPPSAQATLDAIGDAVITTDASGAIIYMNPAAEVMTEWTCAAAMGLPIASVLRLVDGTTRLDVPSPPLLAMSSDRSVGLPPDCVLIGRHGRETAVEVNDHSGHAAGDRLLQAIAVRLQSAVRQSDTVGRYGGDEFVVVLPDIGGAASLPSVATALLRAVTGLYPDVGREVHVSISLGFAVSPRDGDDVATLLLRADRAMYQAKAQGHGRYALFEADSDTAAEAPAMPPSRLVHKGTDSLGSHR